MSLPSGLLFYLDYTYGNDNGPYASGSSIYGGPAGKAIQNGADGAGGQYDLAGSGFSRRYTTTKFAVDEEGHNAATNPVSNLVSLLPAHANFELVGAPKDGGSAFEDAENNNVALKVDQVEHLKLIQHDSQLIDRITSVSGGGLGERYACMGLLLSGIGTTIDKSMLSSIAIDLVADDGDETTPLTEAVSSEVQAGNSHNVRRLTRLGTFSNAAGTLDGVFREKLASEATHLLVVVKLVDGVNISAVAPDTNGAADNSVDFIKLSFVKEDGVEFDSGEVTKGTPAFESDMAAGTPSPTIPEIDIKIESIPVTAQTRKLRARWSPELAQDLNAYHSMDAEVELTQILSEQIALEIDREILGDLLNGAQGANFFWSRSPGKFVNKRTGTEIARASTLNPGPAFTGTVREWYETLTETVIDVANEIHRKTLRGSANFIVVSPDVATVLEASVLYRPSYSLDGDGQVSASFTMGAEKIGTLSNRFTVYKDPYFPRNKILVGYKGGSYLETGFVYAPYVPLIVTPTIFQPDDFTPRKGVMTRYGKKMVRADFYGTVTCLDMNII